MFVRAALLSVVLAGPGVAERPLGPDADSEAILEEINAADPAITKRPAPLERLVVAAELAEARLHEAVEPDAALDLLTLVAAARKVAYQRTGEAVHLCRLQAAAERVLGREEVPVGLSAAASDFREEARAELGGRACEAVRMESEEEPLLAVTRRPAVVPPIAPGPAVVGRDRRRGQVIAGAAILGAAALTAAAMIPVQIRRVRAYRELDAVVDAIEAAGSKTTGQARALEELYGVHRWTAAAKIGLGVSAAVLAGVGVGLLVAGKGRASSRARVEPYGGPLGAGVVVSGRF